MERLPEPPDGALKYMLSLNLILFVYLYPLVRGLILHWYMSICDSILVEDNRNVFVRHVIRRHAKCRPIPTLYASAFSTLDDHSEDYFLWDTDGISFVIDNSATAIISSHHIFFTGSLIPKLVTLEASEGLTTTTKLVGSMKLILTDDANKHHSYIIPCSLFYPKTPVNIFGVPALGTFFADNSDATNPIAEDGITIKSGSTKSHFIWDHGRHERHFMHGSICMSEPFLYVGHGYFKYLCTRVHTFISGKVHFAFSSAYFIYPQTSDIINPDGPHVIPYGEGYLDGEEPHYQWYCTEIAKPTDQSSDSNPKPTAQVTWSDYTKPPASSGSTTP